MSSTFATDCHRARWCTCGYAGVAGGALSTAIHGSPLAWVPLAASASVVEEESSSDAGEASDASAGVASDAAAVSTAAASGVLRAASESADWKVEKGRRGEHGDLERPESQSLTHSCFRLCLRTGKASVRVREM